MMMMMMMMQHGGITTAVRLDHEDWQRMCQSNASHQICCQPHYPLLQCPTVDSGGTQIGSQQLPWGWEALVLMPLVLQCPSHMILDVFSSWVSLHWTHTQLQVTVYLLPDSAKYRPGTPTAGRWCQDPPHCQHDPISPRPPLYSCLNPSQHGWWQRRCFLPPVHLLWSPVPSDRNPSQGPRQSSNRQRRLYEPLKHPATLSALLCTP